MLPSSRLHRFAQTDDQGRRAKLADFVVELPPEGYPPVTHTLFRHTSRKLEVLPWNAVELFLSPGRSQTREESPNQ